MAEKKSMIKMDKKEWNIPTLKRLKVSETKSGPTYFDTEDPYLNFYGPVS